MTMLSRVASHIYWMARYIERAENTARLIRVNTNLQLDLPKRVRLGWEPIVEITGSQKIFLQQYEEADERSVLRFLISGANNPSSILTSLSQARENARTIRDIIPREAFEQVNQLYILAHDQLQAGLSQRRRDDYLRSITLGAQTITGLLAGTMTHDEGYDFLRMGRNLERADMTTRIIDVRSASLLPELPEDMSPFENIQWMSVLKSLTAYQMYRRQVQARVRRPDVLKFLLQETRFPRAFAHTLGEAQSCLEHLPGHERPMKTLKRLQRKVLRAKPDTLQQDELHEFIDELQIELGKLHSEISGTYF